MKANLIMHNGLMNFDMIKTNATISLREEHAELMKRVVKKRDKDAFQMLFAHYGPRVKAFMMGRGISEEQAEDLAQETLLMVWRKADQFDLEKGALTTWIYTIARNLSIDAMRKAKAHLYQTLDHYDAPSEDPIQDEQMITQETEDSVFNAMQHLSEDQKEVIRLAFIEDITQQEIATKLSIPLGTVKSRMRLAYQKLKTVLEGEIS